MKNIHLFLGFVMMLVLGLSETSHGVIGGSNVETGSRVSRSVVALYGPHFGLCTGTLISGNAVLTAAHCIPKNGAQISVYFGAVVKKTPPERIRPVVRMYVSPRWGQATSDGKNKGDIAIVKFSGTLPPGYTPVGFLPIASLVDNGSLILLSGYGVDDGVGQSGSGVLRDTISVITNARFSQTEVQVNQRGGRGTCNGDSGGPAFITYRNAYYLWGVVSRGDATCEKTGIYTNALTYMQWINQTLLSF